LILLAEHLVKNMKKKLLIPIIILEVIIGGLALVYIVSAYWNAPLGPGLMLSTQIGEQLLGSSNNKSLAESSLSQPTPTPQSLLAQIVSLFNPQKSSNDTQCNGPAVMTILLIGSDERSNDYLYGLADSIRVVRVDFSNPGVMMVDIPRDLWVEIPGISDHYGITHGKLNQAYFFGNPGMGYYDGPGEGPGLLARTLDQNFDLQVDHYLAVDMVTFAKMIDTIGGIDVYLDSGIDLNSNRDGADPHMVLVPGTNHLDGQQALRLATNRYPTTFQRARNQDVVIKGLRDKLLSPAMIPEIPALITQFSGTVQTDLSPNDISKLLCLAQSITGENTQMLAFPETMFTSESTFDPYRNVNTFTLGADFDQIRLYLNDFINGSWPSP
jgi:LCP family protein required for cell wall assembly